MIKKIAVTWLCLAMLLNLVVIVVEMPTPVKAGTIWVDNDNTGFEDGSQANPYNTIQEAVDNATPGDTVFVYNGIYNENVLINKTLTLQGEDKNFTIVNGSNDWFGLRVQDANYVNISGFTFESAITSGILISDSNYCVVDNNIMTKNRCGISIGGSFNRIANNTMDNNREFGYNVNDYFNYIEQSNTVDGEIVYYYYDIHGTEISPIVINGLNLINFNVTTEGKITLINCSHVIVENCNLSNNIGSGLQGMGTYIRYSENITILNTTTFNNHAGIYTVFSDNISMINNSILFNDVYGSYFLDSSNGSIIDNSFINNTIGLKGVALRNRTIENNTFISSNYDAFLDIFCDNNVLDSNKFFGAKGFYFRGTINNTLLNNTIDVTSGYGFEIYNSKQLFIINSTIKSNGYNFYFKYKSGSVWEEGTVYLINSSYNRSKVYFYDDSMELFTQWYLHINVTDSLGNPIENANVRVSDANNGTFDQNYTTDFDGCVRWIVVNEYWQNKTMKRYYTPHNIIAWKDTLVGYAKPLMNESKTVTIVLYNGTFMDLEPGWNLISLLRIQSDTNLYTVLQSIEEDYDSVQWFNIIDDNDHWKHYHVSKPPYLNDLDEINHTMGFWLHITNPQGAKLLVFGDELTLDQHIPLYPGWNLVGFPSRTNKTRDVALGTLNFGSDVDSIWAFNSTSQKWVELDDSMDYFEVGKGYWIHSKVTKTWIVPH